VRIVPRDRNAQADLSTLEERYELVREIGRGATALVFLARERATGRLVAIKAIRPRYAGDREATARFAREARTVADLDHPNIVRTYAVEQLGEQALAIVMQYVPGGTLRDALRERGPFPFERATRILADVAEALRYAHGRGIVHRDVKPENIFLNDIAGHALLSDFGIARSLESDTELTLTGAALGTPAYMSPEQIDGRQADGRSDIYSLGLVGWEMLTGRRPWEGESVYSVVYKQKHQELPRLPELCASVPSPLLFAIESALDKHRDTRWANLDEFLAQLLETDQSAAKRVAGVGAVARMRDVAPEPVEPLEIEVVPERRVSLARQAIELAEHCLDIARTLPE
jgi:serine/threonine protein kinase